jgi:hypothetical protein
MTEQEIIDWKMITRKLFKDNSLPYQISVVVDNGEVKIVEEE